ncbi:MAG: 7-carboxy-7-deazaguanine synthase QueE [Candidatus Symbiothrix sp.]|jgi:organic radical activating enzyme|nr:7-carboxy-7-deazaguanine synthase QueE [Candidatus Symbiothrix sp.]
MSLKVKEIFYSLQGEGGRQGEASIFIRLSGCNFKCPFCDTDFSGGDEMTPEAILQTIRAFSCRWIIWTGGEPTLQLTDAILQFFKQAGYRQAIESNGRQRLSALLDYTVVSPKLQYGEDYALRCNPRVDEVRLPIQAGQQIPDIQIFPLAQYYFLSPVFEESLQNTKRNIDYCIEHIMQHPRWRLSVQLHKLVGMK